MSITDDLQKMLEEQAQHQTDGLRQAMALYKELLSRGFVKPKKYDLPMIDLLNVPPLAAKESFWVDGQSGNSGDAPPTRIGL